MSHHKPRQPDPDVVPFDGLVLCTDRSRHRPVRIAVFDYNPEPGNGSRVLFSQTSRWDVISDMRPDEFTLRFKCKLCRRDVRLHEDKAVAAIDALRHASGTDEPVVLDVSLLPC